MAIVHFKDERDAQAYLLWRETNSQGFVLNINTWNPNVTRTKNIIHRASYCSSLDNSRTDNLNSQVTKEHPKLCSMDRNELKTEMITKKLPYKWCDLCNKNT
jgi:hypothetical protein